MRQFLRLCAVAVSVTALSACGAAHEPTQTTVSAASSTPSPSTTATSMDLTGSEISNATQTYLDYVAAYADVDFADTSTWAPLLDLTTDPQRTAQSAILEQFADLGWRHTGASRVLVIEHRLSPSSDEPIFFDVCLDSSPVHYFDASGAERVPPGSPVIGLLVEMDQAPSGTWRVKNILGPDASSPPCE